METSENIPRTCSDSKKHPQEVSAICDKLLKSYSVTPILCAGFVTF